MKKILNIIHLNGKYKYLLILLKTVSRVLPDELYLKLRFYIALGYWPNLDNPRTFSEKLQWLKLYNRKDEYTMMVDKVEAKDYVASVLGAEFIIPTLGVWDDPDKIDFQSLPNKFVLKCNHNSGGVYICRDKTTMDVEKVKDDFRKALKENYYYSEREYPYKKIPRRIIAEKYIDPAPEAKELLDYKIFCFNGEPTFCQVIGGRSHQMCIDFFDRDWNHQPFHEPRNIPFAKETPIKPVNLDKMWESARVLAAGKPFSRIDFYDVGSKVFFGEITFFPTGGMGGFDPSEYDQIFGDMIVLPSKRKR